MIERLIENATALTVSEPAIIFEGSKSYPEVKEERFDFSKIDVTKKIDLLKSLESKIKAHPSVTQVQTASYQEIDTKTTLFNSKGLHLTRQSTYAYAYAIGVFQKMMILKPHTTLNLSKTSMISTSKKWLLKPLKKVLQNSVENRFLHKPILLYSQMKNFLISSAHSHPSFRVKQLIVI